ncbi:sensor histidine kinase [Thiocapsa bogorovii]|uniref:sensor histidine kinase n=1 Tax=Thiocapsa bogorovii TaxID=521689 RepID=UPI001E5ED4A7|nr:ATP-binding protein [Thiocapsa bogorovii]UHD18398.1 ATP-binding protein [Thiocapsa bogorovii]
MIRSAAPTSRLLILPFAVLSIVYLLLAVGTMLWLDAPATATDGTIGSTKAALLLAFSVGACVILIAFAIARVAVRESRRAEGHVQEIYRRASLTEIAAELVHDLRNPLMALRANAKALLVSPDQVAEIAAELDRDIVALNQKLSGFLDLTRHRDEHYGPADLDALIRDAARLAEPVVRRHGLEIELAIGEGLPRPALQSGAIRDALLNLLVNAAQSGQGSGVIRVEAAAIREGLRIRVEDRGCGIEPDDLAQVFVPFFTTKVDGTGLGLSIVRRIVEAHHGRIRIENRAEGGVRVTLILPLEQPEIPGWWKPRTIDSRI